MATIKSYTTIEQSHKLAEILPLESADMYYPWYIEEDGDTIESGHRITTPNIGNFITHKVNKMIFPCWSLAALLDALPEGIDNNTDDFSQLEIYKNHVCYAYADGNVRIGIRKDNLVDACYEMILKLHELKML